MWKKILFAAVLCFLLIHLIPSDAIKTDPALVKKFHFLSFLNTPEQNRANYVEALNYEKKEDYKNAYSSYNTVSRSYDAYAASLFHQAQCAEKLSDEKAAIRKYKQLILECHGSEILPVAHYRLAQIYMRENQYSKAKKDLLILIKKYPDEKYSTGAYYYLGVIEKEKHPKKSREYFFEYLKRSPSGIFAQECMQEVKKCSSDFSKEENLIFGISLYEIGSYNEALSYLNKAYEKDVWYHKAKTYFSLGNKPSAFYTIENGLKNYSGNLDDDQTEEMMKLYIRLDKRSAYEGWSYLSKITSGKKGGDCALYNKALKESKSQALRTYEKIASQYPKGIYASESLWQLFYNAYLNEDYDKALTLANVHTDRYKNTKASPKILFWAGKIKEKQHRKSQAAAYYRRVILNYPDSYYALRASGRKSALSGKHDFMWKSSYFNSLDEDVFIQRVQKSSSDIKKMYGVLTAELLNVQDYDTLLLIDDKDKIIKSLFALKDGNEEKSCFYARKYLEETDEKPARSSFVWNLAYPIHYADNINNSSRHHKLDPYLVIALMREESHFNPQAISSSNAYGLMQILPGTANDVAKWNKIPPIPASLLLKPNVNIKFSTTYLSFLKNKFDGNMTYAVASYNGGYGSVQRWIDSNNYDDIDEFVEAIPYSETQNYVKKVFGSYWNYLRLYDQK